MKIIEAKVTYYLCTYNEAHARFAVQMMCQTGYASLTSRDISHTMQVEKSDLFHAHQLSNVVDR